MKKFLLSIFAVMLTVFSVQAEEYSYTFTSKQFSANGTKTLNNVDWTLAGDGGFWGYDATKGQQFGSGNNPYKSLTLSTSGIEGTISKIVINTSGASSIVGSCTVTVGGTQFGDEITLTKTATNYTLVGNASGNIVLSYTQTSSKAIYIKSIAITYTPNSGGGGETPDVPVVETVATPVITAESTTFNEGESLYVTIETETEGAEIYYTLDGSDPVENGDLYEGEIELTETTTVKAVAMLDGWNNSAVAEAKFTAVDPNAKTTTFDFTKPADLTPSVTTFTGQAYNTTGTTFTSDGVTLNTTDGSTASRIWEGSAYDLRVYKNATLTIAAPASGVITSIEFTGSTVNSFSANTGTLENKKWTGNESKVVFTWSSSASTQKINTITVTYSIDESVVVIAQPSLTPAKSFVGSINVEITNNEEGTTLYYSTNGVDYVVYTTALNITETTTVYAKAVDAEGNESAVAEATYTKIEVLSIAEAKAAYDNAGEDVAVAVDLTGAVVTVNSGQYLFIENETTGINIYNSGAVFAEGTKFTAGYILGTSTTYRNMHQLSNVEFCGVETTTAAVEPLEVTVADIAGNYDEYEGRFVKLTGVSIDADKNMTQGDDEYKAYDRFSLSFGAIANCDVTGVVAIYNTGEQLYIKDITYNLTVTDAECATLFLDFAAAIPDGVEAYTVTDTNSGYVTLTKVEGYVLPANTGVIVKAAEGDYIFAYSAETPADVTGNHLQGSADATNVNVAAYVLANGEDGVGLYLAEMTDGAWLNNANKAYLPASVVPNKTAAFYGLNWNGTTGVENVEVENEVKAIYDLTGRKVETISAPGIYIINGVKRVVR